MIGYTGFMNGWVGWGLVFLIGQINWSWSTKTVNQLSWMKMEILCCTSDRLRIRGLRKIWAENGFKKGDEFLLDNGEKPIMNLYKVPVLLLYN